MVGYRWFKKFREAGEVWKEVPEHDAFELLSAHYADPVGLYDNLRDGEVVRTTFSDFMILPIAGGKNE